MYIRAKLKEFWIFGLLFSFVFFFTITLSAEELSIDAADIKGDISPLIYGTNLYPHSQVSDDIKNFSNDIGLKIFRYPGGGSPGYHWETKSFDFMTRLTVDNCPLLDFDYLVDFAFEIGGEILYQVNAETGTPAEAASLLSHLISVGKRVTYWEIGNEVYGDWDHNNFNGRPSDYATLVCAYNTALKAIDPTVKVGADFGGSYYDRDDWDRTVMREAGNCIDFISYHWYTGRADPENAQNILGNYLMIRNDVARFKTIIQEEAPTRVGLIEITYPEWDTVFRDSTMRDTLANAIAYADSLGEMILNEVTVANHYAFQEGDSYHNYHGFGLIPGWDTDCNWNPDWGNVLDKSWDGQRIKPKAFAMKLFSKKFGEVLLGSALTGTTSFTKSNGSSDFEYQGSVPYISAYSSINKDGDLLSIILSSKKSSGNTQVNITLSNFAVGNTNAAIATLSGPSLTSINNTTPGTVSLTESTITNASESFTFSLPPRSVVSIQIQGQGSGDYTLGDDDDDDDDSSPNDNISGQTDDSIKVTSGCGASGGIEEYAFNKSMLIILLALLALMIVTNKTGLK